MPKWTIAFDATLAVEIDAGTEGEAIELAEGAIERLDEEIREYINRDGDAQFDFSLGSIYLIKNEDTGDEVLK